ncbi:hypothetical protein FF38_03262 [Lucilia cuprina]|uniref:Uncharacterized protein n=1 Tax=Lucilia cuprina TaxID=7375 RepID=A0A0L0CJ21_LUCCU|nr:hypothetical protein FF38_03262 [Lucilia cuprina]
MVAEVELEETSGKCNDTDEGLVTATFAAATVAVVVVVVVLAAAAAKANKSLPLSGGGVGVLYPPVVIFNGLVLGFSFRVLLKLFNLIPSKSPIDLWRCLLERFEFEFEQFAFVLLTQEDADNATAAVAVVTVVAVVVVVALTPLLAVLFKAFKSSLKLFELLPPVPTFIILPVVKGDVDVGEPPPEYLRRVSTPLRLSLTHFLRRLTNGMIMKKELAFMPNLGFDMASFLLTGNESMGNQSQHFISLRVRGENFVSNETSRTIYKRVY